MNRRCDFQPQDAAGAAQEHRCDEGGHSRERAGGGPSGPGQPAEVRHHIHGQPHARHGKTFPSITHLLPPELYLFVCILLLPVRSGSGSQAAGRGLLEAGGGGDGQCAGR